MQPEQVSMALLKLKSCQLQKKSLKNAGYCHNWSEPCKVEMHAKQLADENKHYVNMGVDFKIETPINNLCKHLVNVTAIAFNLFRGC